MMRSPKPVNSESVCRIGMSGFCGARLIELLQAGDSGAGWALLLSTGWMSVMCFAPKAMARSCGAIWERSDQAGALKSYEMRPAGR